MIRNPVAFADRLRERLGELAAAKGYAGVRISEDMTDSWSFRLDAHHPDGRMRYSMSVDRMTVDRFLDAAEPERDALELLMPEQHYVKVAAERLAETLAADLPALDRPGGGR